MPLSRCMLALTGLLAPCAALHHPPPQTAQPAPPQFHAARPEHPPPHAHAATQPPADRPEGASPQPHGAGPPHPPRSAPPSIHHAAAFGAPHSAPPPFHAARPEEAVPHPRGAAPPQPPYSAPPFLHAARPDGASPQPHAAAPPQPHAAAPLRPPHFAAPPLHAARPEHAPPHPHAAAPPQQHAAAPLQPHAGAPPRPPHAAPPPVQATTPLRPPQSAPPLLHAARPDPANLQGSPLAQSSNPHIVLVLADDLGWNDVGWNGGEIETPHLNALREGGVSFTEFHAHSLCTPSRAALLSGRYAFHTGLQHAFIPPGGDAALPRNITLLGQHLQREGYATHMVGKWHLGHASYADTPLNRGFDTFYGFLGPGIGYTSHAENGIFDMWDGCHVDTRTVGDYSTELFTSRAIEIIRGHDPVTPMFLYLAYNAVHSAFQEPPHTEGAYPWLHDDPARQTLAKMVTHLDSQVNKVVEMLESKHMWSNTVLVFTSDNGGPTWVGNSNWPLRGSKATMWQGGVKVPTFMVHGGGVFKTSRFDSLAHLIDLAPTLLAAAGLRPETIAAKGFDGQNLWPALTGRADPQIFEYRHIVFNVDSVTGDDQYSGYAGIRNKVWKMVLGHPGYPEYHCRPWINSTVPEDGNCHDQGGRVPDDLRKPHLWNLETDPAERMDVARDHPEIVEALMRLLQPYIDSAWVPLITSGKTRPADEALLMVDIIGAWGPWQSCPQEDRCVCDNKQAISSLAALKRGALQLARRHRVDEIVVVQD